MKTGEDRVVEEMDFDDTGRLREVDSSGMLEILEGFPRQIGEALEIAVSDIDLPRINPSVIAVLGMGGSGISGDVVASLLGPEVPVPFLTIKGYHLPACVNKDALVFAVSYSGNTEETLSTMEQAMERGARVVAVTSGGKMERMTSDEGVPCFKIPSGLQPRASLGYLTVPVLVSIERMGLVSGIFETIRGAIPMLEERSREYRRENPLEKNPTKRLASDLIGYLPIIYGSEGPSAVAALRWKTQFNENSKAPAFANWFSELNHNETVGWQELEDFCSRCYLVVLRQSNEHPRVGKRIGITIDLIGDRLGHVTEVYARGRNELENLLDLIYFGDFTAVYLALALGEDPTPVDRIEELKRRMAEGDD